MDVLSAVLTVFGRGYERLKQDAPLVLRRGEEQQLPFLALARPLLPRHVLLFKRPRLVRLAATSASLFV